MLDYSKDIVIGKGIQGPFDHLFKLKSNIHSSPRQHVFDPSDLFLYAVTDSGMNRKWGHSITDAVKAAIEGGATIVQLRFAALQCVCFLSQVPCSIVISGKTLMLVYANFYGQHRLLYTCYIHNYLTQIIPLT